MADLKLFNLKTEKPINSKNYTSSEVQAIIETNCDELLGIKVIASNYLIKKGNNEIISTLGIDENYTLVIIEYRNNRFGKLINKGLVQIDYIKENISEFKILIGKKNKDIVPMINYNPRLIIIGNDFVKYDEHAIQQLNSQIDLIRYIGYSNSLFLIEKHYQSKSVDHSLWKYRFSDRNEEKLYIAINDYLLSLGDEVIEVGYNNYLYYRKIKTFMYITFEEEIHCRLLISGEYKSYPVKSEKDFDKLKDKIEKAYDQN